MAEPRFQRTRRRGGGTWARGALLALLAVVLPGGGRAEDRLPAAGATVSGISSGAFVAVQFQVVFSGEVAGVGAVAGGPFLCAEGSASAAVRRCMHAYPLFGAPDAAYLLRRAGALAAFGHTDPLENLARGRVYVSGGGGDETVRRPAVGSLVAFNRAAARRESAPAGRMLRFGQAEFLPEPRRHGMDEVGFAYLPPGCEGGGGEAGEPCRVHVVFHGCEQGRERIEDLFPAATGYLNWADSYRLIVLIPQAAAVPFSNPQGCWDFFAYDDPDHATHEGRQVSAVKRMLDRLQSPELR